MNFCPSPARRLGARGVIAGQVPPRRGPGHREIGIRRASAQGRPQQVEDGARTYVLFPTIVPVHLMGYSHLVVFRGIESDRVLLADPAFGNGRQLVEEKSHLGAIGQFKGFQDRRNVDPDGVLGHSQCPRDLLLVCPSPISFKTSRCRRLSFLVTSPDALRSSPSLALFATVSPRRVMPDGTSPTTIRDFSEWKTRAIHFQDRPNPSGSKGDYKLAGKSPRACAAAVRDKNVANRATAA